MTTTTGEASPDTSRVDLSETGRGISILIVEDQSSLRKVLLFQLRRHGFTTLEAGDGLEALEVLAKERVDMVISDVMMPRMDGFELCRRMRNDRAFDDTFIVMLTAKSAQDDTVEGLSIGADDYIPKPYEFPELLARVKALLRIKGLQDELRDKNRRLQELSDMKDEFMGMAAHDLRSPLTVIKAYLELMDERLDADTRDMARACQDQVTSMHNLLTDLLDITRIESGKVNLCKQTMDPAPLFASRAELYAMMAEKKDIALTSEIPDGLGMVSVDPDKIGEIAMNMLSNAVKYSRAGDSITVTLSRGESAGGAEVVFAVSDTGPGISPDETSLLFVKFAKISTRPTGDEHKTGLGLAIVKKLAEVHGGRVWAESEVGRGSTFFLALPLVEG